MAEIGFVGLGKLGLPVALAIESKGHNVIGYDVNPAVSDYIANAHIPFVEEGLQPLLDTTKLKVAQSIGEVVANSDIVFLPVQTPHAPEYEGSTRIPETRADFDYTFLKQAVGEVALHAAELKKPTTLAVISTCLPGTFTRELKPLLNEYVDYVYTPQFIAMGTVLEDYLYPEFNLIGVENEAAADKLEDFYKTINNAPSVRTDVTTAEGIKVSYNTWITAKTVIANAWGEMAHKTGMNFDDIKQAWDLSTKRLISPKYTNAGVGDSGGCHPRDNIAMSYIADKVNISHNIWENLMASREEHMEWLGDLALEYKNEEDLPLVLVGKTFKIGTNLVTGSSSILLANILNEKGETFDFIDPIVDEIVPELNKAIYLVLMPHEEIKGWKFPDGSVIIDVWRALDPQDNTKYVPVGNPNAIQDQRRKI